VPGPVNGKQRVVIIGAGFAGLSCAKALKKTPLDVVVIDRANYHLFQPLLYQVATAGLSPAEIAVPIRHELAGHARTEVLMAEVTGVDMSRRTVSLQNHPDVPFDYLVVATGARHSYFGHQSWEPFAPGLKQISDATMIRKKVLLAFERAEMELNPDVQDALLNFVVVGGGPTGVEIAGALAELATRALKKDFRRIDPTRAKVHLVEAGPRVLAGFPERLSEKARVALVRLGVNVRTGVRVTSVTEQGVQAGDEWIAARTVLWAAGVECSPAGKWLGVATDNAGRVRVKADLSIPSDPRVFVAGDCALAVDRKGGPLPGIAPVAMQAGRHVARAITSLARGEQPKPFRYVDKGTLATIGRSAAVGVIGGRAVSGLAAWLVWALIHIYFLVGFKNRTLVLFQWMWAYFTFQRGARIIQEK
jgi:NADH:ubiquinone reductase (H+-translocating)